MEARTISLTSDEYEALLNWAKLGATNLDQLAFLAMRRRIDVAHQIKRYTLVIRWQRLTEWNTVIPGQALDALPTPRGETRVLELLRPPMRADVLAALEGEIFHEALLWVTADPKAELGWCDLEHFPWQG